MSGMTNSVSLLPGANAASSASASSEQLTLGVMGGGQLGRMFVHAAQTMGYFTAVLDPDAQSPAGRVSHRHIQTDYTDPIGLKELAACSAAITTEFENVPAPALRELAKLRPVSPGADAVAMLAQSDAVLLSKLEKFRKDQTALAKAMTLPPLGGT